MYPTATASGNARSPRKRRGPAGSVQRRLQRILPIALLGATAALSQSITNTSGKGLNAVVAMGILTPGMTSTITSGQVTFQLDDGGQNGYRLTASASFVPSVAATVDGGATIAARDIGIGITSATRNGPRGSDTILAGFSYDPSTVTAIDGLTPYAGAASGSATLADLLASKTIVSGTKINGNPHHVTVTMKFGLLPQYFSPSTFSAVITLTISGGP